MLPKPNTTCKAVNSPVYLTGIFVTLSVTGILTAALGNSLIFLAVCKTKALKTPSNYLLVSLSLASLMLIPVLASYAVSLTMSHCHAIMPDLCKWSSKIDFALFCVVMGHLVIISLDQLVAIKRPLRYVRKYSLQIGATHSQGLFKRFQHLLQHGFNTLLNQMSGAFEQVVQHC